MPPQRGTLELLARHLALALAPLGDAVADLDGFRTLMRRLGWDVTDLPPAYQALGALVEQAVAAADALADDPDPDDVVQVLAAVGRVHQAVGGITQVPGGIAGGDATAFLAELAGRLFELLLTDYLAAAAPSLFTGTQMLGVIETTQHEATPTRPAFLRTELQTDRVPGLLTDPGELPRRVYGWGTEQLRFELLRDHVHELLWTMGLTASIERVEPRLAAGYQAVEPEQAAKPIETRVRLILAEVEVGEGDAELGLVLAELPAEQAGATLLPPGVIVQPAIPPEAGAQLAFDDHWVLRVRAGTDLASVFGVLIRPGSVTVRYPLAPSTPFPPAGFGATLAYTAATPEDPGARLLLLGRPGRSRVELGGASFGLRMDLVGGEPEVAADLSPTGLAVVVSAADLDGFIGGLLGGDLTVPLPLVVSWSSRTGLTFSGSARLAVAAYPHRELGPVRVDEVSAAVGGGSQAGAAELVATVGVGLSGTLGPIGFSVAGIGLGLRVGFAGGNAGPLDVAVGFQPPTGLGLAVDAGPVSGGGIIRFEPDRRRYVGMVELDAYEIEITAIAILETRDAAGRDLPAPGFSLLMIVAVDLPPIQLGFGFTLNGVGGLVGINRRLDAPALLAGVRSGAVGSIMFPDDPVRDAPVILGHLGTILPLAVGRHVFAPMALIGWGTPTLIDIELAVVLEVPAPVLVALIGQASVRLPDDPPVVVLNVDVVGVLDYGRSLFALDASLRDSRVAGFPLAGDLAMRLGFGANPSFALAVGGFNPHFEAPPGFPTLRRVSLALGQGDNPRVSIEGYLAVTSNSLQFGAKAELFAEAGSVNVKGWLAFDALFVFEPFSFRFDFAAGMSLNRGSRRIAGITVDGTLTGPNPFHAWGEGCLSLLFFDICVPFDATFGARRDQPALPPADPWVPLRDAIALAGNWSAELPPGAAIGVTLRRPQGATGVLVHPMGVATLRQRVVPLNRTLERFGQFPITGPDRFDLVDVLVGDASAGSWRTVTEHFAPGDFEALSPTEQLSRDSFELMDAGVRVGTDTVEVPTDERKTAPVAYETKIIDAPGRVRPLGPFRPDRLVQVIGASTGAKARSVPGAGGRERFARDDGRRGGVRLEPERYTVATKATLAPRAEVAAGVTRGAAHLALKHAPATASRDLQVVPAHELDGG
jgi:hypothetical protein